MPPRRTPAQIQAQLRRLQQQQRQAQQRAKRSVDEYNRQVRKAVSEHNAAVRQVNREIDRYNAGVRSHNARVKQNRDRLRRELTRLGSQPTTVRVTYRTSVQQLTTSYELLERRAEAGGWADNDILSYSAAEAANSAAALNALLDDTDGAAASDEAADDLQATRITSELDTLNPDLGQRWRGALFALNPKNPDAARHFCTSAREMLADVLSTAAPTEQILQADPACERTQDGKITRRARIRFCLQRNGHDLDGLADFVEADMDNVLALFAEFNSGTHGSAGRFTLQQLRMLKQRVEDAVLFVLRLLA